MKAVSINDLMFARGILGDAKKISEDTLHILNRHFGIWFSEQALPCMTEVVNRKTTFRLPLFVTKCQRQNGEEGAVPTYYISWFSEYDPTFLFEFQLYESSPYLSMTFRMHQRKNRPFYEFRPGTVNMIPTQDSVQDVQQLRTELKEIFLESNMFRLKYATGMIS